MMVPMLALAGNLAQKKSVPPHREHFPVNTTLFTVLLVGVILIVGALTFFPRSAWGPSSNTCCCTQGKPSKAELGLER
jgi:K+-transporting ATPase ATPase A chain